MAFHFPLQAVLHFRQSVEHQQELRLRTANQQVARVRHLLDQIDAQIRQVQVRRARELDNGTTSAELRYIVLEKSSLDQLRQDAQHELERWQNLRDQQQRVFQQARRERETFESLRDHQLRAYQRDATRHEQRDLDDLFLLRQAYRQHG